jgi:hypothetical protein
VWVCVGYFVWRVIQVFVFDGYVHHARSRSLHDWGAVAHFWICFNVWVFGLGFLHSVQNLQACTDCSWFPTLLTFIVMVVKSVGFVGGGVWPGVGADGGCGS